MKGLKIKSLALSILLCSGVFSASALALNLEQARQQGWVGETLSGYLAPVKPNAEAQALVTRINQAREEQYRQVAEQNQVSTDDVAKLAGQKLVTRAAKGEYVRGINGQWLQK